MLIQCWLASSYIALFFLGGGHGYDVDVYVDYYYVNYDFSIKVTGALSTGFQSIMYPGTRVEHDNSVHVPPGQDIDR